MKNEGDVKKAVQKILNSLPFCWWVMPVQTGYGKRGIPDFMVCLNGKFVAIETKYGGNTLSAFQELERNKIIKAQGDYYIIDEKNIGTLEEQLGFYSCE